VYHQAKQNQQKTATQKPPREKHSSRGLIQGTQAKKRKKSEEDLIRTVLNNSNHTHTEKLRHN
jgi:hypothetical protein